MRPEVLEEIEIEIVVDTIRRRWGIDFSGYKRDSLSRQLHRAATELGVRRLSSLVERLVYEETFSESFVSQLFVSVTSFFRDPDFFRTLANVVLPELAAYPRPKIWHAGCATGEEVYSLAFLLDEAGLLQRSTIYATDINMRALRIGRTGAYPLESIAAAEDNYRAVRGPGSLDDYFVTSGGPMGLVCSRVRDAITWSAHDLTSDGIFAEVDLVLCRNTLIYFGPELRAGVVRRFRDTLSPLGYLALGASESLDTVASDSQFRTVDAAQRIYQRSKGALR
ncbi:MAG: protein-glutamate O-methyltransferase CheR [Deltaproteobacteria bacterium]|jgi:chemotaxis protein methyltransferase CheR